MLLKLKLIPLLLLTAFSSHSQPHKPANCATRVDELYAQQKIHLIYCSFYFEEINSFSGADSILKFLYFYRDTTNAYVIKKQDHAILANLKKGICNKDTSLLQAIKTWCEMSKKIAKVRAAVDFTIEGYMDLLYEFKYTKTLVGDYLDNGRVTASLSSDEMERVYFSSVGRIRSLNAGQQNQFFNKFKNWHFE